MPYFNTSGTYGAHWHGNVNFSINAQDTVNNRSSVHVELVLGVDSGYSQNASSSYSVRVNGGTINSGSQNLVISGPTSALLVNGDVLVYADGNGNTSGSYGGSFSSSYGGVGSGSGDYGFTLPRMALPPTIDSITISNVKSTRATLAGHLSSYGHGTSGYVEGYYRLGTTGGFTSLGNQAYTGTNTWSITGLKPGTLYQYTVNSTNNNGDLTTGSYYSFKTQAVSGMISVMQAII